MPEPGNPQAFNRYSYALNNPIRYTDPTGHDWFKRLWEKITKAFIAEVLVIAVAFILGGPNAAFSVSTLIAATSAAAAVLTLDTGEERQLQERVAQEVFDDALGMSPGVAQTFSSITLHMALTAGYNTALNAMIFNPNLQGNVDEGQTKTGPEGRSESATKEVNNTNRANKMEISERHADLATNTTAEGPVKPAPRGSGEGARPYDFTKDGSSKISIAKAGDSLNVDAGEAVASKTYGPGTKEFYESEKYTKARYIIEQGYKRAREQSQTPWDPPDGRRLGTDIRDAIWLVGVDRGWW